VQQVAVAGLDIDEAKADVMGQARCRDELVDQTLQLIVGPNERIVAGVDAAFRIQEGMMVSDARLQALVVRLGKPTGVRQLQTD